MSTGREEEAAKEFADFNAKNRACLEMLKDTSVPMFAEMKKRVDKFAMSCDLLDAVLATYASPTDENKSTLADLLERYNRDAVVMTGFCLREAAEKALRM